MKILKFFLEKNDPTRFNIRKHLLLQGLTESDNAKDANFTDENIGVNDQALQTLEYKHLLAQLLQSHHLDFMPQTYHINDYNFAQVLTDLQQRYANSDWQWIYKPSTLNNGEAIKLFSHINEIVLHYQTLNRLGGDFVIQHYIDNPNLLNGHKYTLRLYVVLSNFKGHKLYPHGYYNIGRLKYPETFITNEHLTDPLPNVIQMPTSKVPEFYLLMPQINHIVDQTIEAFARSVPAYFAPTKVPAFDILGFDFLLDDTMRLWLLEINHGPWFPTTELHNLQQYLYNDFWEFVTNEFARAIIDITGV